MHAARAKRFNYGPKTRLSFFLSIFAAISNATAMLRGLAAVALLIVSNTFMTFAWYGQIAFKSRIALFEYWFLVPANRLGSLQFGGPFSIWELKVIQEVVSLTVFSAFVLFFMKSEALRWNHIAGFLCLILAVYFIFRK